MKKNIHIFLALLVGSTKYLFFPAAMLFKGFVWDSRPYKLAARVSG